MSGQLLIEPAKFARLGGCLSGRLDVASMPRLRAELREEDGAVCYEVRGFLNQKGVPALEVSVSGEVRLSCQRCLGLVAQQVSSKRTLVFLSGLDEFAPMIDEDESEDVVPNVQRLDLRELIEEEVLLSLPISARHAELQCDENAMPQPAQRNEQQSSPESPFAVLGALKR
jgi:uncharacterized protein